MAREIERVKREYEEKQQRKKNKDAEKEKDKKEDDKDKEKDDKSATKKGDEEDKKMQKERDDKVRSSLHISFFYVLVWLYMYSLTYHRSRVSRNRPPRRMTRRGYLRCISISLCSCMGLYVIIANSCRNFYQMRIDRMRNAEMARRNRQRLQDPSLFPSVPTGGL